MVKFINCISAFLASFCLFGQSSIETKSQSSAAEFIKTYGAQQRMIDSFVPYSVEIKSKFLKLPNEAIAEIRDAASSQFFCGLIAGPFMEVFSPDELQELIKHFKTPGCQKIFNSKTEVPLNEQESLDLKKFTTSDVGIRFQKEWPAIKDKLSKIAKFWSIDLLLHLSKKYPDAFKQQ